MDGHIHQYRQVFSHLGLLSLKLGLSPDNVIIIQGFSHIGIIICGLFTQSKWTILGSIRSIILYIIYDMILLMSWLLILPHNKLFINNYEIIGTLHSYLYIILIYKLINIIYYYYITMFICDYHIV